MWRNNGLTGNRDLAQTSGSDQAAALPDPQRRAAGGQPWLVRIYYKSPCKSLPLDSSTRYLRNFAFASLSPQYSQHESYTGTTGTTESPWKPSQSDLRSPIVSSTLPEAISSLFHLDIQEKGQTLLFSCFFIFKNLCIYWFQKSQNQ